MAGELPTMTADHVAQMKQFTTENIGTLVSAIKDSITSTTSQLVHEFQVSKHENDNKSKISEAASVITKCDGTDAGEIRNWLRGMKTAVDVTSGITDHVHRLARKTTSASLYRDIYKFAIRNIDNNNVVQPITWTQLSAHVIANYLGANEQERLRLELSKMRQGATPTMVYNRKFKDKVEEIFPGARNVEVERMVCKSYVMSLADRELARKIVVESGQTDNLEQVIAYVDKMTANMEYYDSLFSLPEGVEPMDCSTVSKINPTPRSESKGAEALIMQQKRMIDKQNSKIAKLEADLRALKAATTLRREVRQEPVCYNCHKTGHFQRDCRSAPRVTPLRSPSAQNQPQPRRYDQRYSAPLNSRHQPLN